VHYLSAAPRISMYAITNEVLEPITFVLAYPIVFDSYFASWNFLRRKFLTRYS